MLTYSPTTFLHLHWHIAWHIACSLDTQAWFHVSCGHTKSGVKTLQALSFQLFLLLYPILVANLSCLLLATSGNNIADTRSSGSTQLCSCICSFRQTIHINVNVHHLSGDQSGDYYCARGNSSIHYTCDNKKGLEFMGILLVIFDNYLK